MSNYDDAYFDRIEERWAEERATRAPEPEPEPEITARILLQHAITWLVVGLAIIGLFLVGVPLVH